MSNGSRRKPKVLGTFGLLMINIIAITSLRNLSFGAIYGLPLIFCYVLSALIFFIPTAFVAAELATTFATRGGLYVWIREAFGEFWGFFIVWLQWVYNVVWYPTILTFIAGAIAYLINPQLADNKIYMLLVINLLFWGATIINCFGMRISGMISTVGALFGTLLPMVFIIILGVVWVYSGKPTQIQFTLNNLFPDFSHFKNIAFLAAIMFSLVGIEMSAMHADEVKSPAQSFPRAIFNTVWIVTLFLILASLAISVVVPHGKINLITGVIQAFRAFFNAYNLAFINPVIVFLIILSGLSNVAAWIIGPTKGLSVAAADGVMPRTLAKNNRYNAPVVILVLQAVVFTLLSFAFILMPTVSSSYWILVALSVQLTMLAYIFMFIAALRLRYKPANTESPYRIPGGKWGIWLVSAVGVMACVIAIGVSFVPPQDLNFGGVLKYELILICSIILTCLIPFAIYFVKSTIKNILRY